MSFAIDSLRRVKAVRYLLLNWRPDDITREIHYTPNIIYYIQRNLWIYGSPVKSRFRIIGCPRKITPADEGIFIQYLLRNPTSNQEEMT